LGFNRITAKQEGIIMQISKLSSQSFGCSNCHSRNAQPKSEQANVRPNKMFTVSRNAMIAALTGLLTSCASDTYTFGVTPEGNPIIFNQDGDCLDIIPHKAAEDYYYFCEGLDNKNPNCTIAQGLED